MVYMLLIELKKRHSDILTIRCICGVDRGYDYGENGAS